MLLLRQAWLCLTVRWVLKLRSQLASHCSGRSRSLQLLTQLLSQPRRGRLSLVLPASAWLRRRRRMQQLKRRQQRTRPWRGWQRGAQQWRGMQQRVQRRMQ